MHGVNAALAVGAGALAGLGVGLRQEPAPGVGAARRAALGICVGPVGLDFVDFDLSQEGHNAVLLESARVTLALSVMGRRSACPCPCRFWGSIVLLTEAPVCDLLPCAGALTIFVGRGDA